RVSLFSYCSRDRLSLHSFPTRRSSDLTEYPVGVFGVLPFIIAAGRAGLQAQFHHHIFKKRLEGSRLPLLGDGHRHGAAQPVGKGDRKSTRLNSSHVSISYAVFCLKKKS